MNIFWKSKSDKCYEEPHRRVPHIINYQQKGAISMKRRLFFTNRATGECRSAEELTEQERKEIGLKLNLTMLEAMGATPMKVQKDEKASA